MWVCECERSMLDRHFEIIFLLFSRRLKIVKSGGGPSKVTLWRCAIVVLFSFAVAIFGKCDVFTFWLHNSLPYFNKVYYRQNKKLSHSFSFSLSTGDRTGRVGVFIVKYEIIPYLQQIN